MFTSFSTALSALYATSTAIDVVGNNLANLNTTGYKTSVVSFHDLVTQSLGAGLGETQVGFGTARPLTERLFTQGAVQASAGVLDAAVQGDGFFMVKDSNNSTLYTRAGSFQVDAEGNLLTSTKERVQGWTEINGAVNTNGATGDIKIPVGQLREPVATKTCSVDLNLNAAAVPGTDDGSFSTTIEAIDSLGNPLVLTMTFTKDATTPLQWNAQVSIPGDATTGGTPGTPTDLLATPVALVFNPDGTLASPDVTTGSIQMDITGLSDHAADITPLTWNIYNSLTGRPRVTQFSQPSAASANAQDGQSPAQLIRVGLGDGGTVLAQYSNGTQKVVARLALASIRNPQSLIAVGSNNYQTSAASALPAIGIPDTGGRGKIMGGSLESSTVDIASEFTELIVLQRAYQANSRVITAVDELSQDTINLKR
jgi:flagellar hook protein FlgE